MAEPLSGHGATAESGRSSDLEGATPSSRALQDSTDNLILADVPGVGAVVCDESGVPEPLRSLVAGDEPGCFNSGICPCGQPVDKNGVCGDSGCADLPRYISVTGRDEARERRILRVIYGAKQLANAQLGVNGRMQEYCERCQQISFPGCEVDHHAGCAVGEVSDAIEELQDAARAFAQSGGAR